MPDVDVTVETKTFEICGIPSETITTGFGHDMADVDICVSAAPLTGIIVSEFDISCCEFVQFIF